MADGTIRLELEGALAGRHVLVDPDALTFGLVEDLQSGRAGAMLDSLASAIVGGDLPRGTDRAGLRALTPVQMQAVIRGIDGAFEVPKSGA